MNRLKDVFNVPSAHSLLQMPTAAKTGPAGGRDLTMGAVTCCFPGASPGSRIGREAEASPGTQIQRRGLLSSVFTSPGSRIRRETEMSPRH